MNLPRPQNSTRIPGVKVNKPETPADAPTARSNNIRHALQVVGANARPAQAQASGPNKLALLIDIEGEARECRDIAALRFAIVNATRKLVPFNQAFLLESKAGPLAYKITAASSTHNVDRHAPLPRAIEAFVNNRQQPLQESLGIIHDLDLTAGEQCIDLPAAEVMFPNALWVPLKTRKETSVALLALRAPAWDAAYPNMLAPLAGAFGHAWDALTPTGTSRLQSIKALVRSWRFRTACLATLIIAAFVPVPLTALAPAEIVAASPELINAPVDGVIKDIPVAPGAAIDKGTVLIRFDDTRMRGEFEVAARAQSVAEAKYFRVLQSALSTQKDMQDLAVAKAELALAGADLNYARESLSRSELRNSKAGIVLYSSKTDWIGRPVTVGERIMEIADPNLTEVRVDLPVADAIALKPGGKVALFLDGNPLRPIDATIDRISYRPVVTSDRAMVFRVIAKLPDGVVHRIGLRGTARLSGETVSMAFYLFRRPVAFLRQKIGF